MPSSKVTDTYSDRKTSAQVLAQPWSKNPFLQFIVVVPGVRRFDYYVKNKKGELEPAEGRADINRLIGFGETAIKAKHMAGIRN